MEQITSNSPKKYTEEEIRSLLAVHSQKELEQLNPDYLIGWSPTGNIPQFHENIRFGDLPLDIQNSILRGLESSAKGESSRWEFK